MLSNQQITVVLINKFPYFVALKHQTWLYSIILLRLGKILSLQRPFYSKHCTDITSQLRILELSSQFNIVLRGGFDISTIAPCAGNTWKQWKVTSEVDNLYVFPLVHDHEQPPLTVLKLTNEVRIHVRFSRNCHLVVTLFD